MEYRIFKNRILNAVNRPDGEREKLLHKLYDELVEEQKAEICDYARLQWETEHDC